VHEVGEALVDIVDVEGRDFHPAPHSDCEVRSTRTA
jgi:hypothetical protein